MQNKDTLADTTTSKQNLNPGQDQLPLVVGVDLGGTQIRTAVLRGPTLRSRVSLMTGKTRSLDRVIPRTYTAIQEGLGKEGTAIEEIAGSGISATGLLEPKSGL